MKTTKSALTIALLAAFMPAAVAAQAESGNTALTIYSTARPGALSPEFYRGGGNNRSGPRAPPGFIYARDISTAALLQCELEG